MMYCFLQEEGAERLDALCYDEDRAPLSYTSFVAIRLQL